MEASYRFVVAGTVQGVGFRVATRHKALGLGLRGWVRNHPDGRVEGLVTGPDGELVVFRRWLDHGPPTAWVTALEWTPAPPDAGEGFLIHR